MCLYSIYLECRHIFVYMTNHDSLIIKVFFSKSGKVNPNRTRKLDKYPNIKEYLDNRYEYSSSYIETLNRIYYCIDEHPVCPVCGKYVSFGGISHGVIRFKETCSQVCANKYKKRERTVNTCMKKYGVQNGGGAPESLEKIKNTNLNKYGVDHVWKNKDIRKKCQDTLKERYGVTSTFVLESSKKTISDRYGEDNIMKTDIGKSMLKESCVNKYGTDNIMKTGIGKERLKESCLKKYGVEHVWKDKSIHDKCVNSFKNNTGYSSPIYIPGVLQKIYDRKKKNGTFNTSKPEEELYLYIKEKFPLVERQYKCDRYPYNCDFYIPDIDMFIELQGNWTHGNHPYNSFCIEDQEILQEWKTKSKDHPYYINAINTWCVRDVQKRNTAKENHLNYIELFMQEDINLLLNKLDSVKNEKIDRYDC